MNLIQSIFRGASNLRADISGSPAPWDDFWYQPIGGHSAAGMRVSPDTAKRISTVLACVTVKARQLGMLPIKIYTDNAGGGKRVVTNHPLYDVLYSRPNNIQTALEFKQMMQAHVELRGNAYAEIVPGARGAVDQLVPMHPDRVKVEILKSSGRLRYVYNDPVTGETRNLMQEEVFHLRDFPDSTAVGQSRVAMACDAIGIALAQQDYYAKFLKNDATPNTVITGTNFRDKVDEDNYRKAWEKAGTGENRHKVKMLPPGIDVKTLSVSLNDMQLLEAKKYSAVEICTIFGVLPHLIGIDAGKSSTYASVEQFNIMNQQLSVLPMVVMWEQAIQRDLILNPRYYAKMSMASLLRGDSATRAIFYNSAIASGWMSPDDVRELEDLNPIPDGEGQTYWRPMNWAPLGQTEAPAAAKNASADPPDDQTEQGAGDAAASKDGRLHRMAVAQADRCVRREVSGVKRLIERKAGTYEATEFYAEQERFIVQVFDLDTIASLLVHRDCGMRAQQLSAFLGDEDFEAAAEWIEQVAQRESARLVAIATGETQ